MSVIDSLFTTWFREDGSHSPKTLPEYASQFLADIEHRFGPRDRSFALVGIDIDKTPGNVPRIWFPNSGIALTMGNGGPDTLSSGWAQTLLLTQHAQGGSLRMSAFICSIHGIQR